MTGKLINGIQKVSKYASVTGMFTLLIMMLITTFDVIGRNLFRAPIVGAYELTEFMLVVVVLLGMPYTQQVDGNARITLFVTRLTRRPQAFIDGLVTLFSLIFFWAITWGAWKETLYSYHAGGVSDLLRIPKWPFKLLVAVGIFLLSLELVIRLIRLGIHQRNADPARSVNNEPD